MNADSDTCFLSDREVLFLLGVHGHRIARTIGNANATGH